MSHPGAILTRAPARAAAVGHDLIVIGGGIQGTMVALVAAAQGLCPVLLEQHDFGGATSWNSLRIIHGGLRYLQSADLPRLRRSVKERGWFLRQFPDLVKPLPCVMPLYREGIRRRTVLRAALAANQVLSRPGQAGLPAARRLEEGGTLDPAETLAWFPLAGSVRDGPVEGAALWFDAVMTSSPRVLIESLRWACRLGAIALNYVKVTGIARDAQGVTGVQAIDQVTGRELEFHSRTVVNCAGPWLRELAARADRDRPELFQPSLAFNLMIDRPPLSEAAIAVSPGPGGGGPTYFLHQSNGCLLAGTYHLPWSGPPDRPEPPGESIAAFLTDLNLAIPGLSVGEPDILRIHAGVLPARKAGTARAAVRDVIVDHGERSGPPGLFSVSGVKYTTARELAERVCRRVVAKRRGSWRQGFPVRPAASPFPDAAECRRLLEEDRPRGEAEILRVVQEEAVVQPDDLLLRRSDWGTHPVHGPAIAQAVGALLRAGAPGAA